MLVADAFDAITSARPYSDAQPVARACEELRRNAGTQFDPACVAALVGLVEGETPAATTRSSTVGARAVAL
jgi:HD-GYP domain-containing protein (c-di-GMP phosphodiesterase class II)